MPEFCCTGLQMGVPSCKSVAISSGLEYTGLLREGLSSVFDDLVGSKVSILLESGFET